MRTVTRRIEDKYVAWLAGYYDDFNGSQCVADDLNTVDVLNEDHTLSHHGNTLNGEAPLNPTYRFSVIERESGRLLNEGSSALANDYPTQSWQGNLSHKPLLHNEGVHDYITCDTIRLSYGVNWEGKATNRAPQSFFHQNRAYTGYTGASVTNGYMLVSNPSRTGTKYWFPIDNDASHKRSAVKDYTATTGSNKHGDAGSHLDVSGTTSLAQQVLRRQAYSAGVFQWQSFAPENANLTHRPGIGFPITSLGGKNFMCLDMKWRANAYTGAGSFTTLGEKPLMIYDGTLNAIGDKDRFHIRLCAQAFAGLETSSSFDDANVKNKSPLTYINVGYHSTLTTFGATGVLKTSDSSASASAIRFELDWATIYGGKLSHAKYNVKETQYSTPAGLVTTDNPELEDVWVDVDIECDFTNQSYQVFINGVASGNPTSFATAPDSAAWTADVFYGWSLSGKGRDFGSGETQNPSNKYSWNQIVMVDRVCFGRNITHHIGKTASAGGGAPAIATGDTDYPSGHPGTPVLQDFNSTMSSNSLSMLRVTVIDDMNNLNIYPLISGGTTSEYMLMVARNGDNRFILRGVLSSVNINQKARGNERYITLSATDPANLLNRQIPVWDIGQDFLSGDTDKALNKRGSAEALYDALYFGVAKLKIKDDNIGYEHFTSSRLTYMEHHDQRTSLHSAHPIQMYNNEDDIGPNFPERDWLYKRCRVITPVQSSSDGSLSGSQTLVHYASHGLSSGSAEKVGLYGSTIDADNITIAMSGLSGDTDVFVITTPPPAANATTTQAKRWEVPGSATDYAMFLLDPASFTSIPEGLEFGYISFNKTGTFVSHISNKSFKILGIENRLGQVFIYTDVPWSRINSSATHTGLSAFSSSAGPWNVYWQNPYIDYQKTGATSFNKASPYTEVVNRSNHSVWMRDLPKSLWFKKMFGRIKENKLTIMSGSTVYWSAAVTIHTTALTPSTSTIQTNITYANTVNRDAIKVILAASGVGEVVNANGTTDSFVFNGCGHSSGGYITLTGVKYLSGNHAVGKEIKFRDISDDYKHIWLLWADMRNSGNANADGGKRKNDFGLTHPTPDNYSISLSYTDQEDWEGTPVNFVDLGVGLDCDIWECDAEIEPYSGNPWSALGSDSHSYTEFRNWEDKAGAFIIIDFSKFFNLNTEANGGRTGQKTGQNKTLGDLVVDTEGHPALIDDYWQEVVASPKNTSTTINDHPNWYNFFSSGSNLASTAISGNTALVLEDTSEFPSEGIGLVELERESSGTNSQERNNLFFIWTSNNTSTNTLSGVTMIDIDESRFTADQIKTYMFTQWRLHTQAGMTNRGIPFSLFYNDSINAITNGYDKIVVYSGMAAPLALRFQMSLNGFVESKAKNTFLLSDQIRALSVLSSTDTHLSQFTMPVVFSIKNMPITNNMTTTQSAVSGSTRAYSANSGGILDYDTFGGSFDARGKSVLSIIGELSSQTRLGDNGTSVVFTYTTGRDGRLDFRPAYSSGFAFTRDNLRISNMSGSPTATVSNVRVHYNNGSSFADYPHPIKGTENRWKFIEAPDVRSSREANAIAKSTYEKSKISPLKITAETTIQSTETDQMLYGARFGYIQDPALRSVTTPYLTDQVGLTWTSWFNGIHFSGSQNALDGNISFMGTTNVYNTNITGHGNGGGISFIDDGDIEPEENYGWVGIKSISDAVEIVHIPKNMPLRSNASANQQLRVGIQLADSYNSGTTIEDVEFYLVLYDPNTSFSSNSTGHAITDGYGSKTSLKFKHNGFHEISIPSTYWTSQTGNERIVVSINSEYLRSLLRHKNGKPTSGWYYANKEDMPGMNTTNGGSEVRTYSPFPLGIRTMLGIPTAQDAPIYQAPRIGVVEDINFYPSTKITYTDASLGISSPTAFSIMSVNWQAKGYGNDKITFVLEKDESKGLANLSTYIMPEINKGRTPQTIPTSDQPKPGGGGGGGSSGGGGGGYKPGIPPMSGPVGGPVERPEYIPIGNRNFPGVGPGAISGQVLGSRVMGVNNTTPDLMKRITGNMDLHSEFGLQDGDFSILGQKKSGATPQVTKSVEGSSVKWDKKRGAIFSAEGAVLPGLTAAEADNASSIHAHTLRVSVPDDVIGQKVTVDSVISIGATSGSAALYVTLECIETSESITAQVAIDSLTENLSMNLIAGDLQGASTPGNTIKLTIRRQANSGSDTSGSQYCSVVLHKTDVKFVRSAINARSSQSRLLGLKSGGVRNL